jgi:CHAT domain-containing protein
MKTKHESSKGLLAFGNPSYTFGKSSKGEKNKTNVEIMRELYLEEGFDFSPLPHSKKEILEISKYFPEKKREVYIEKKAKEETFKNVSLKDYQVIHFACHGFMAEKFPFRSALVLSLDEDPKEDGFLQVRELYNLRMKADLVVLSACQTGKGKMERGEGILGLPRIFFYMGARSVISTLWKITDESTAKFMDLFYQYLAEGNDKSQALRLAKLEMIDSKYSHPFYWAAFVLNGDYSSTLNFK